MKINLIQSNLTLAFKKKLHALRYACCKICRYAQWPHAYTLNSALSGPGSRPGLGDCVAFLGKTLFPPTVLLSTQVYKWELANLMLGAALI